MSNGISLLRYVIVTSSLLALPVLGDSLPKNPHQSFRISKTVEPELEAFTVGKSHDVVSFTQARSPSFAQASDESIANDRGPLAEGQVSGIVVIPTLTTVHQNPSKGLIAATPTIPTIVPSSGSMNCGGCNIDSGVSLPIVRVQPLI